MYEKINTTQRGEVIENRNRNVEELYQEIMWKEGKRRDKLQGRLNAYFIT